MKTPAAMVRTLFAAGLLAGTSVFAGSFNTTFADATGITLAGGAFVETNRAILTWPANSLSGGFTVDDFDAGQAIESFTANFKLQIGPGSGNAADGVSFSFGPGVTAGVVSNEEGPGAPGNGTLTIAFDTYDNGGNEAPSLDVKFEGNTLAKRAFSKSDMVTSQLEDVAVTLTKAGKVSVVYKGTVVHTNVFVPGWTPVAGLFGFSARTGGENEEADVANLSITTVLKGADVAPTILTPPANATVNEGGTTNFTVSVDGTAPFTFQWTDNGADIAGETGSTLTMTAIPYTANNHQIRVRVSNAANPTGVTSAAAILTVIRDTTAPTVVKANANEAGTQVIVVYSEPVTDTALVDTNYRINNGAVPIQFVERVDASRVKITTTAAMPGGLEYTLTINGVQDTASSPPNTIAANTQVKFRTFIFQVGAVVHKKYNGPAPDRITGLQNDPRYPGAPDRQDIMTSVEYPANGSYRDTVADPRDPSPPDIPVIQQYTDTLECFFIPPTTNDYVFYAAGADINDVYLSTDEDPANMVNIAQTSGWTNPREWMISQCGTTNGLRSDWYTGNLWPGAGDPFTGSALIRLDAGRRYYLLAVHHRYVWSGADDFAVTFAYAGSNAPASGAAPLLTGSLVGAYLDPTGASVTFSQEPADVTILQGRNTTLTGVATGQSAYGTTVVYQWQTAPSGSTTFTNLPGETKSSYTTPILGVADSGRQYKLLASVPGFTVPSRVATVTVNADTIAPQLVSVCAIASETGSTLDVGVTFNEPVDPVTAGNQANYSVSAGSITGIKLFAASPGVVLTVSGLTSGTSCSVTVSNVKDPYNNAMTSANLPVTYSAMRWGAVGVHEANLGYGVLAVSPNSFDVYSDGIGAWAAYDEATLVYEEITGDFDKEVRVEYQDASSQWARAGLIAKDVTNFGDNRATQEAGAASRYQKAHVSPVMTAMGTAGNNSWEGNRRLEVAPWVTLGEATSGAGGGGTPAYPNAWCRLQRIGQTFNIYRSNDGQNWTQYGSTTFTNNMPAKLYVGLDYAPENGNVNPTSLRSMWLAKFRDYRSHSVPLPIMTYEKTATGLNIYFEGTLQSADTVNGTYTDITPAPTSPYSVTATGAPKFYRARK